MSVHNLWKYSGMFSWKHFIVLLHTTVYMNTELVISLLPLLQNTVFINLCNFFLNYRPTKCSNKKAEIFLSLLEFYYFYFILYCIIKKICFHFLSVYIFTYILWFTVCNKCKLTLHFFLLNSLAIKLQFSAFLLLLPWYVNWIIICETAMSYNTNTF